jgi:hypothetical protein
MWSPVPVASCRQRLQSVQLDSSRCLGLISQAAANTGHLNLAKKPANGAQNQASPSSGTLRITAEAIALTPTMFPSHIITPCL